MANILKETVRGTDCIKIEDELLSRREIFLTEEVNAETSNELIKQLMYLERQDSGKEITLYINSPGGEVISGLAVYDLISLMKSPVRTVCTCKDSCRKNRQTARRNLRCDFRRHLLQCGRGYHIRTCNGNYEGSLII